MLAVRMHRSTIRPISVRIPIAAGPCLPIHAEKLPALPKAPTPLLHPRLWQVGRAVVADQLEQIIARCI